MSDNRRWTFRMSDKDSVQAETLKMFDKLMATEKFATDSELFREGVRALYHQEFSSAKQAAQRRLIEKYSERTVDTTLGRMGGMLSEAIGEALNQVWEQLPEVMSDVFREVLTDVLGRIQIPASGSVAGDAGAESFNPPEAKLPDAAETFSDDVGEFLDMF